MARMRSTLRALSLSCLLLTLALQGASDPSRHHVFINEQFIWTLEMVRNGASETAVLNIISFEKGEWLLRPRSIRIHNGKGERARIEKFSLETGMQPIISSRFKVLGNSFVGIDLIGEFEGFGEPARVSIDLGEFRYRLAPIDPLGFENLADQINRVNYDSPDVSQDYEVLGIRHTGTREPRPKRR